MGQSHEQAYKGRLTGGILQEKDRFLHLLTSWAFRSAAAARASDLFQPGLLGGEAALISLYCGRYNKPGDVSRKKRVRK